MQYSFTALAFLAITGLTAAQGAPIDLVPECARQCIEDAAQSTAIGCEAEDYECYCENISAITPAAVPCVTNPDTGCEASQIPAVLSGATKFCDAVKAGGGSSPSSSEVESTTVVESTTAAPVETSTSTSAVETTEVTSSESVAPSTTAPAPTSAPSGGAAPTGSVPTSSIPPFEGGAAQAAAGVGSFFAAGMAVLAAF